MNSRTVRGAKVAAMRAVTALILGMLLSPLTAQAADVQKDGNTATGITDLRIGRNTYDVAFLYDAAPVLYPFQQWDFDTRGAALAAVEAVVGALNAEGDVLFVGESAAEADAYDYFAVPYDSFTRIFDPPWFFFEPVKITFLKLVEGYTGDPDEPGVWVHGGLVDGGTLLTATMYAKFTLVGEGGPGNQPPVADAGGPYSGTAGVAVTFDGGGSDDLDGTIVDYDWNFGDGSPIADGKTPSHTYAVAGHYNVTLEVTDNDGVSDSDSANAFIGSSSPPPVADANGPYTGAVDSPVSFDGSGSNDPDGIIVDYDWNFGDGSPIADGKTPSHTYTASGHYSVSLTVTNGTGESDTDSTNAFIGTGNLPPVADAGGSYAGSAGDAVSFDGTGSRDPNGDIVSYEWDFGDGNLGSGASPSHTYSKVGNYTVRLTVTDDDNVADSDSTTAVITIDLQPRREVLAVSDANGNSSPDVALVRRDTDGHYRAHVYDGSTGAEIRMLDFGTNPLRGAVVVERSAGTDDIATMSRLEDGSIRVLVKNTGTGATVANLQYGDAYTGIDLASADIDGDGSPEVGVVGEDANQKNRIFYKNVDTGAVVAKLFQSATNRSRQLLTVPTVNGGTAAEAAVSGTVRDSGATRIRVQDTGTSTILQNLNFGTLYPSIVSAVIPDAGGPGQTGVADMGVHVDTGKIRIQNRDAATGAVLTTSSIRNTQTAVDLSAVSDVNQDNQADIAALVASEADKGSVWIFDAATGTQISTVPMTPIDDPVDLAISTDINGNGSDELLGLGERDDGVDRIAIFDSVTGDNILLINVP